MVSRCSRLTVAPVGLFGDATMISFVRGVIAAMKRSKGNSSEGPVCTRVRCEVIMPIETSYMKNVGVQITASSPSSRNAQAIRWMASSTPLVSNTCLLSSLKCCATTRSTGSRSG